MKKYELLVVGGGPAAITLAKILGKVKTVGIIRPENYSMIYCAMPYAIEKVVALEKTFKQDSLVTEAGADLIRDKVARVDFTEKTVFTEQKQTFGYEKLVIATGSIPFLPPIEGADYEGVHVFKWEDDLKCLNEAVRTKKHKKAVVVGAGAIGIELALALNNSGLECHLVDMEKTVLPNLVDPEMSAEAEAELVKAGVKLHLGSRTERILGDNRAEKLVLNTGEELDLADEENPFGLVVFSVGMRPRVKIFADTPLDIGKNGIVVNSKMETNIPDVYSVGDCAQYISGITGELTEGKLATNAVPMARLLAKNMLGANREYTGFFNGAATRVGDLFVGGTGLSETAAKKLYDVVTCHSSLTTTFPIMPEAKPVKMKMIADRKTLRVLGAQVVSGNPVTDKVDVITLAIQNKLTMIDLANFSYSAQPYQSFFPANNLIVSCAEGILDQVKTKDLKD